MRGLQPLQISLEPLNFGGKEGEIRGEMYIFKDFDCRHFELFFASQLPESSLNPLTSSMKLHPCSPLYYPSPLPALVPLPPPRAVRSRLTVTAAGPTFDHRPPTAPGGAGTSAPPTPPAGCGERGGAGGSVGRAVWRRPGRSALVFGWRCVVVRLVLPCRLRRVLGGTVFSGSCVVLR